jgi:DNA-binding SARP family transcriptional activator
MQSTEDLEFRILGPLEVRRGQVLVPICGRRESAVLTILLLSDGEVVTMDQLVEAVWDCDPPQNAIKAVRNCVSALRRRTAESAGIVIPVELTALGYRLRLEECRLDLREFRHHAAAARRLAAEGDLAQAVTGLRTDLGLWRGPALAGSRGRILQAGAVRLDEERMVALEDCLDLELALGRHRQVASELLGLAREQPLRERIAGQLMIALHRSGRQAEALDTYHQLARRLAEDLGINPSAGVTRLHEAILRQDPSVDYAPVPGDRISLSGRTGPSGWPRPAQLPLDAPGFTGRTAELARLHGWLPPVRGAEADAAAVVIPAIVGTAGVGKTALAVRFAHQVAGRFPDGQLYINLRGFDPSGCPLAPADVLRRFLITLGVAAETIPVDIEEQETLYRSLMADKRVLLLLDNARDSAQVRPLLPGSPGCLVIVTSRNQLTGLVVAEGACPLALDVLTSDEAWGLLASRLGSGRLSAEPAAVRKLVRLCGQLPLALAIVAARSAARPGLSLADLAVELHGAKSRLDALITGDPATDLRTAFSWSCQQLGEPAARMFRLLGLHPGPDITAPAAASLARLSVPDAAALLAQLARHNLITEHAPGRYTFHDLLRAYAADLANMPDAPDDPHAAVGRLFAYYLSTAAVAMNLLYSAKAHRRPHVQSVISPSELDSPCAALSWLDNERNCLLAVASHVAGDWPGPAVQLSAIVERYLEGGHYRDGLRWHGYTRDAARQAGDRDGEAAPCAHPRHHRDHHQTRHASPGRDWPREGDHPPSG